MPEVNWHPLEDLAGIGPSIAADLGSLGFHYAENLLRRAPEAIAQDLNHVNGITLTNVMLEFIPQAKLLRLDTLHVNHSAALGAAGFDYGRLCFSPISRIERVLDDVVPAISPEAIGVLQLEAAKRLMASTVTVRVVDESGAPAGGAEVFVVDPPGTGDKVAWRFTTNVFGEAFVEFLTPTLHRFMAVRDDSWGESAAILRLREYCTLVVTLSAQAKDGITFDEAVDGPAPHVSSAMTVEQDIAKWPEGTLFQVLSVEGEEIRVAGFYRQRIGATWRTVVSVAPAAMVSGSATEPGELLRLEQGQLVRGSSNAESFRQQLWRDAAISSLASRLGGQGHA